MKVCDTVKIIASVGTVSVSNGHAFWIIFDQRKICFREAKSKVAKNEFEQEMPGLDPLDFVEDTQTHDR